MLHFLFDQLVWECRELEAPEPFLHGLPREPKLITCTGLKQSSDKVLPGEKFASQESLRHQDWCKALATYSRSQATFEKDRLIAIKGVAKAFSKILDDEKDCRTLEKDVSWQVYVESTKEKAYQQTCTDLEHCGGNYRSCTTTSSKKLVESSRELSNSIVVLGFRTRRH
jgi:hypothetical protein